MTRFGVWCCQKDPVDLLMHSPRILGGHVQASCSHVRTDSVDVPTGQLVYAMATLVMVRHGFSPNTVPYLRHVQILLATWCS